MVGPSALLRAKMPRPRLACEEMHGMKRAEEIAELERRIDDLDLQTALHSSSGLRRETQARFDSGQESSHRPPR